MKTENIKVIKNMSTYYNLYYTTSIEYWNNCLLVLKGISFNIQIFKINKTTHMLTL